MADANVALPKVADAALYLLGATGVHKDGA
jgi:hypothetical protein